MKNSIPFILIVTFLIFVFAFNGFVMNKIEHELLNDALIIHQKTSKGEDITKEYDMFVKKFNKLEVIINTLINHSVYNEIAKCITDIGNAIEFDDKKNLVLASERLVFNLKNVIEGDKCKIHNIL